MKRSKIVRLELLLLAVVTLLLAYRVVEGPPVPDGLIVHSNIEPEELRWHAFSVDQPVRIAIDAVGSFESERENLLSAYGWLLRREDRSLVWNLDATKAQRDRATLAVVKDSIDLQPGTYDVYFTSIGNRHSGYLGFSLIDRLFGKKNAWRGDADKWQFLVRAVDGQTTRIEESDEHSGQQRSPSGPGILWSTAPMEGHEADEFVFRASGRLPLRLYAVGEIDDRQMDYGWIENVVSGERIWEMTLENTQHAGGWKVNRDFDGRVTVPEGIYRAAFETDPRQNFGDWVGNPPFDPAGWGMTIFTDADSIVTAFDPWTSHAPFVQIDQVGDSERHSVQFRALRPVQVAAFGLGEMGDRGRYDYGWIRDNESQQTVWEMTPERSRPAGGHNNRRELAFLDLPASTYTVTYETDDSHSYDSWRHGRPDYPERWGVTLFLVDEAADSAAIEILDVSSEDLDEDYDADVPEPPVPPGAHREHRMPVVGQNLVDLTRLGNDKRVSKKFTLDEERLLHLRALGEVSLSGRYDYGWIEEAESGEIVWEMTWQNTHPAGGTDKNRMFDGTIRLGPGTYVAHFKTDFSHAFGDFDDQAPIYPEGWGIYVVKPEPPGE